MDASNSRGATATTSPRPSTDTQDNRRSSQHVSRHTEHSSPSSPTLPEDLPKSLDDRRSHPSGGLQPETEMYDAWQGQSQFLTTPVAARPKPLSFGFNLALDDGSHDAENNARARYGSSYLAAGETQNGEDDDEESTARLEDGEARLMEMLAAQAAHREGDSLGADEEDVAMDAKLGDAEKKDLLQRSLNMAASNGDTARVQRLVSGHAKEFVDVNMPDEEGTVPLIYASCFVRS